MNEGGYSGEVPPTRGKKKNRKNEEQYTATTSLGTSATHSGTAMTRSDTVTIHFDSYNLTQADDDEDMREGQE